jgi:hypothetical protein
VDAGDGTGMADMQMRCGATPWRLCVTQGSNPRPAGPPHLHGDLEVAHIGVVHAKCSGPHAVGLRARQVNAGPSKRVAGDQECSEKQRSNHAVITTHAGLDAGGKWELGRSWDTHQPARRASERMRARG